MSSEDRNLYESRRCLASFDMNDNDIAILLLLFGDRVSIIELSRWAEVPTFYVSLYMGWWSMLRAFDAVLDCTNKTTGNKM